jgi:hypothetical protein
MRHGARNGDAGFQGGIDHMSLLPVLATSVESLQ